MIFVLVEPQYMFAIDLGFGGRLGKSIRLLVPAGLRFAGDISLLIANEVYSG